MRAGVMALLLFACVALLSLSSCVSQGRQPGADLPSASRHMAQRQQQPPANRALEPEYRPQALNVGTARLSYAAGAGPKATRTITVEPAPPPHAVTTPQKHVVAPGETLIGIARARLGSESRWREIVAANPVLERTSLQAGQTLELPR